MEFYSVMMSHPSSEAKREDFLCLVGQKPEML
jgi:hypothetical protein